MIRVWLSSTGGGDKINSVLPDQLAPYSNPLSSYPKQDISSKWPLILHLTRTACTQIMIRDPFSLPNIELGHQTKVNNLIPDTRLNRTPAQQIRDLKA